MCEREGTSCESKPKDQVLPKTPNLQSSVPLWSIFTLKQHHHTHPISTTVSQEKVTQEIEAAGGGEAGYCKNKSYQAMKKLEGK